MFMKTLIDGYITPMLTQPDPDFGPLLHAILRVAGFTESVLWLRSFRTVP